MHITSPIIAASLIASMGVLASYTPDANAQEPGVKVAVCTSSGPAYQANVYCSPTGAVLRPSDVSRSYWEVYFSTHTHSHTVWVSISRQYADSPNYYKLHDVSERFPASFGGARLSLTQALSTDGSGNVAPGAYRIDGDMDGQPMPTSTIIVSVATVVSGGWGCPPTWKKAYMCPPPKPH